MPGIGRVARDLVSADEDLEAIIKSRKQRLVGWEDGAISDKYAERPVFGIRLRREAALLTLSSLILLRDFFQQLRRRADAFAEDMVRLKSQ